MRKRPPKSLAAGYGIALAIEEDQEGATPSLWYRLKDEPKYSPPGRWQFWSAASLLRSSMRAKKRIKKHWCSMCGLHGDTEIHHIYPGAHRKKSDEYDFVIEVCHSCHRRIHDDPEVMRALKRDTQLKFEKTHSHEEFIRRMGKSWL